MAGRLLESPDRSPKTDPVLPTAGPPPLKHVSHTESTAATEQSSVNDDGFANPSDEGPTDSGYASFRNTPTREYAKSDGRIDVTKRQLEPFDKAISQAHRQRFADLQELLVDDLRRYILKKLKRRKDCGDIAWRLKCLGKTEETARPWIIILCDKSVADTVRKYIKRSEVKEQCCPKDDSLPSFDVHVCPITLQDLAAPFVFCEHLYAELATLTTLCGMAVSNVDGENARSATLGGVVKIEKDGRTKFLAMTAGHIFDPLLLSDSNDHSTLGSDDTSDQEEDDDDSDDSTSEDGEADEDDELELDLEEIYADSNPVHLWEANHKLRRSADSYPSIIGLTQYRSSSAMARTGRDLDWTLFGIEHALPNVLNMNTGHSTHVLQTVSNLSCAEAQPGILVWIITSHGTMAGSLQPSAFLLRPGAKRSIHTFIVKITLRDIDEGVASVGEPVKSTNRLHVGDSGSWVVTQDTKEVIGYVLASDVFEDVYVVPFQSALDDIKQTTDADFCGLFDSNDLLQHINPVPIQPYTSPSYPGYVSDATGYHLPVRGAPPYAPEIVYVPFSEPVEQQEPLYAYADVRDPTISQQILIRRSPLISDTRSISRGRDSGYMSRNASSECEPTAVFGERAPRATFRDSATREEPKDHPSTTSYGTGIDSGYSSMQTSPTPGPWLYTGSVKPVAKSHEVKIVRPEKPETDLAKYKVIEGKSSRVVRDPMAVGRSDRSRRSSVYVIGRSRRALVVHNRPPPIAQKEEYITFPPRRSRSQEGTRRQSDYTNAGWR